MNCPVSNLSNGLEPIRSAVFPQIIFIRTFIYIQAEARMIARFIKSVNMHCVFNRPNCPTGIHGPYVSSKWTVSMIYFVIYLINKKINKHLIVTYWKVVFLTRRPIDFFFIMKNFQKFLRKIISLKNFICQIFLSIFSSPFSHFNNIK